jgi:hypothetical protein
LGPKIRFAETAFDFGEVKVGELVKHSFAFTNAGNEVLEISRVRVGCGCTTAGEWDHRVAPGATGTIPVQFNSAGFSGAVSKGVTVVCNDPTQTNVVLQIKGKVWTPISLEPKTLVFNYDAETPTNETKILILRNNLKEAITLGPAVCANSAFQLELKTVEEGREFALAVTLNPSGATGTISGPITFPTSVTEMPILQAQAYAFERQPLLVTPTQISLPEGPLRGPNRPSIMIRNNGTNQLTLSELSLDLPGVECHLKEIQAGRLFSVVVLFPAGFQMAAGAKAELSLRSNHPRFPVIRVPVVQLGRGSTTHAAATGGEGALVSAVASRAASPAPE